jgi:hypothetical protein
MCTADRRVMKTFSIAISLLVFGCGGISPISSKTETSTTADGSTSPNSSAPKTVDYSKCKAHVASAGEDCHTTCRGSTQLSTGGSYCTDSCVGASDCERMGSSLACLSGTCVPKCTDDSQCTALGFKQCYKFIGGCSTI